MKTKKRGEVYISCLASNYKQPIAVLVERLLKVKMPDYLDGEPLQPDVDYAIILVVLLVLQFEAWDQGYVILTEEFMYLVQIRNRSFLG